MGFTTGQIINGKYRVIRLLGDGGMGSVYEAHHEVLNTRVALKLLHEELTRTGVAKRFLQEARASARIKSRHVITVADADQTPDGQAFIVLEYLEGKTLRETYDMLAKEQKKLPFADALNFAMQMFEGVEAAHAAGIVHRDLKPDNVMITQDSKGAPLLKLLDFGIAKVDELPESGQALTRPGALLGTPEYMAPEQVYSANSADVRSDVFSLGVILFEMLSGRRPVLSDDPQQIAVSYLTGAFTRLEDACPEVPPALAAAVHTALAAQPRDRFASVADMRTAVEPFAPAATTASMSRMSLPALAATAAAEGSAPARKPLPETMIYSQVPGQLPPSPVAPSSVPPTSTLDDEPAVTRSANIPRAPAAPGHDGAAGGPKPRAPAAPFTPEYPSAMGPMSGQAPATEAPRPQGGGTAVFVPEYPPPFAPNSYPPPPAVGIPQTSALPVAGQPAMAPVAPRPASKAGLFAGIALAVLLVGTGITIGALYYLGWLDPDPPAKQHRAPTARPHPTSAPTHRPPNQLR